MAKKLYPDHELYFRTLFFTGLRSASCSACNGPTGISREASSPFGAPSGSTRASFWSLTRKTHRVRQVDVPVELAARWQELRQIREAGRPSPAARFRPGAALGEAAE